MANAYKRVVAVPVDTSENSKIAFEWYVTSGYKDGDLCVLIHAVETPHLKTVSLKDPLNVPYQEWQEALQKNIQLSQKLSDEYLCRCQQLKIQSSFETASGGKTGLAIVEKISDVNADLVVMGTRGLSGMQRALLGSVSSYVIQNCGKPVTIVPNPKK